MTLSPKDIERFWPKVNKQGPAHPSLGTPCWVWTASKRRGGYGSFKVGGRLVTPHRISWLICHGFLPPNLNVLHRCDNPPCCNPAHLFLGTDADNAADRDAKGRCFRPDNSGERQGRSKLTDAIVAEMRRRYRRGRRGAPGVNYVMLGKEFGVSALTARAAVIGLTWKHVKA